MTDTKAFSSDPARPSGTVQSDAFSLTDGDLILCANLLLADALAWEAMATEPNDALMERAADRRALACRMKAEVAPVETLEAHAHALGRIGPLGRAISVFEDVLADIADWEDKALAEAVTDARRGLLMMLEAEKLKRAATPIRVPRVIASGAQENGK